MKRVFGILAGLTFLVMTMAVSFAEDSAQAKDPTQCEKKRCEQCKCKGMMHAMMPKSLIETKDGGIVVMTGTKLIKFDKDLNLMREVALPIDMESMQKMKMHKMGDCPRYKKMMQEGSMGEKGSSTKRDCPHKSE